MSDLDLDELRSELDDFAQPHKKGGLSLREERISAGFEEIERFVEEHGRAPQHGEDRDIFERLYAVRLDRLRESPKCREVLKDLDSRGLLGDDTLARARDADEETSDEDLLASLGAADVAEGDVTKLVHVRSREEINAAEEIARRTPCKDFDQFKPIFEKVQHELDSGVRKAVKYEDYADIKQGDMFILGG